MQSHFSTEAAKGNVDNWQHQIWVFFFSGHVTQTSFFTGSSQIIVRTDQTDVLPALLYNQDKMK